MKDKEIDELKREITELANGLVQITNLVEEKHKQLNDIIPYILETLKKLCATQYAGNIFLELLAKKLSLDGKTLGKIKSELEKTQENWKQYTA